MKAALELVRRESDDIEPDGIDACDTADLTDGDRRLHSFAGFTHL